jgi:hypothetical protein
MLAAQIRSFGARRIGFSACPDREVPIGDETGMAHHLSMKTRPRLSIALLLGILSLASVDAHAAVVGEKCTFVLVHGATAGLHDVVLTGHSHGGMVIEDSVNHRNKPTAKAAN